MANLTIHCPGQPDQVIELADRPVSVGRGDGCTAFIGEKKASRKHLVIKELPGGAVVAEDLGSANGTWFVGAGDGEGGGQDRRFLRRVLEDGDVLRIGETTIHFEARAQPAPTSRPLVSGTLQLTPAASAPAAPVAESEPSTAEPARETRASRTARYDDREGGPPPPGGAGKKSMGRALVLCAAAVCIFAGVEIFLGASAEKKADRKASHLAALKTLETMSQGSTEFQKARDAYALAYPGSKELLTLDRYVEQLEERESHVRAKRAELESLLRGLDVAPHSEIRFKLLQMRGEFPGDDEFQVEVRRALAGLDSRRVEKDLDALRALDRRVRVLLEARRFSQASRLLAAFDSAHEGLGADARDRWNEMDTRVRTAIQQAATELWAQEKAEQDPVKRRRLLAQAWPVLVGTKQGRDIGDRLRSAASLAAPRSGAGSRRVPGTAPGAAAGGATPAVPTVSDTLLARATKAEELLVAREWVAGRAALASLVEETEGGRLLAEWKLRLTEVDHVLGLVKTLGDAAGAERKPRRKLSDGTWNVTGATPEAVTLTSKRKGTKIWRWSERDPADVLTLLTPARISLDQRLSVALLAAGLGDREAFLKVLIPVYENGGALAQANNLVARHLYGRAQAPTGGYTHHKGELLDQAGLKRRVTQERIATLRAEAQVLLAKVAKDPSLRKLRKLKETRAELDKRRRYALTAIFNKTHYPYPANKGSKSYQSVQREIDRRVARVRELWDDPFSVRIARAGKLSKLLDEWDVGIAELEAKQVDVSDLKRSIAPFTLYVTDEPITIRSFYLDDAEREWLAYCDWVRTKYNPARREVAKGSEHRQVQITNAYRMMMGYTAVVTPGSAPVDSINKDNVIQILDQAKLVKTTPLRAVRVDNRLVMSARLHSEDMARRGYFAHQAPPNPATGAGSTGPADRMQGQRYRGWSYSENIAQAASPQRAHDMWCHSSGHHRNILSGWTDLGSGVGGRNFTQNFAGGGGSRPQIYADTAIRNRESSNRRGGGGRGR